MAGKAKDKHIGKRLGDYRLIEPLATGGMAKLYIGEDVNLGRRVAVKVLTAEMMESDSFLAERFKREAKAVAQLDHPNIVPIYQYREEDGLYFLAMKLIDGQDLADEIYALQSQGKAMSVRRMLALLKQVAAALDHAHENGIIHRDVKPSNILVEKNSEKALLTDFGLVLELTETNKTMGTAFGTPRYISPEQALASEKAVPQSDIYALAVIVFEILTGSQVFRADTAMQVALSHISEPPPAPTSINPEIPKAVEREILKSLEKKPNKRHKTATAFIQALEDAYGDKLTSATIASRIDLPKQLGTLPTVMDDSPTQLADEPGEAAVPTMPDPDVTLDDSGRLEKPRGRGRKSKAESPQGEAMAGIAVPKATGKERKRRSSSTTILAAALLVVLALVAFLVISGGGSDDGPASSGAASSGAGGPGIVPVVDPVETGPTQDITANYNADAFVIVNTGGGPLSLDGLRFRGDGNAQTFDAVLQVNGARLDPDECLLIVTAQRRVSLPEDWGCAEDAIRNRVVRWDDALFWRGPADETFRVDLPDGDTLRCDRVPAADADAESEAEVSASCTLPLPTIRE